MIQFGRCQYKLLLLDMNLHFVHFLCILLLQLVAIENEIIGKITTSHSV